MITRAVAAFAVLTCLPVQAAELSLPSGARALSERRLAQDSYALPLAIFGNDTIPNRVFEGRIAKLSWQLNDTGISTLQVLTPLRDQLTTSGYDILFECRDRECGGFEFRFGIDVIPAPDMHVNLRDYRFLSAKRGEEEATSLLISRLGEAIFIQMIHVASGGSVPDLPATITPSTTTAISPSVQTAEVTPTTQNNQLAQTLQTTGHVVLGDLIFESGASRLGSGPFTSLQQLATYLTVNPSHRIALVGHTDSVGSLTGNISLSKRRAGSVRRRMITTYDIESSRIEAEGMGYLAPVASNLSQQGRDQNRRVEAILLSDG